MTKPPPPEGYRDWCEWFIEHSDCNDFKSLRRAGFKDTDNIRVPTWAGADYDALEAEVEKLRAEVERLRSEVERLGVRYCGTCGNLAICTVLTQNGPLHLCRKHLDARAEALK